MRAAERRLETITGNLSNTGTPAYKRRTAVAHAFEVGSGDRRHLEVATTYATDFSQGSLERTGNTFDVALMGQGFFSVDGPDGEIYTRNGKFRVDDQGVLLTAEGYPVAFERLTRAIDPFGSQVVIDGAGNLIQDNGEIGKLKIVDFANRSGLQLNNEGYYLASAAAKRQPAEGQVHQFALESSNSSSVDELISMIIVQRSFEAASNMMQMLDQSYRQLNNSRS